MLLNYWGLSEKGDTGIPPNCHVNWEHDQPSDWGVRYFQTNLGLLAGLVVQEYRPRAGGAAENPAGWLQCMNAGKIETEYKRL